jgi:hypothetical protein
MTGGRFIKKICGQGEKAMIVVLCFGLHLSGAHYDD